MHVDKKVRRLFSIGFVAVTFWIAGCGGSRPPLPDRPDLPDAFPMHSLAQIQNQIRLGVTDTLASFQGKASLALRSRELSGNVTARVEHRRQDSLYMSLTATLGIEAARMLVTPDSFFVYDRLNKTLNYGSMDYAEGVLPATLTGDNVFPNLLGLLVPETDVAWQLDADTAYYHLRDEDGRRHYIIDPTVWRVVRYEERTAQGKLIESRNFAEYDVFDGVFVPRRIILRRPMDDTSISMYYRELTLNPPALSMTLRVGDSVERVLIDENTTLPND